MNIKDIIQKLNTLNIEDLKNIDINKLRDILKQSPVIIINLALIGGTFFFAVTFWNKCKIDAKKFTQTSTEYEEKLTAVKEQNAKKKVYEDFINNFPKPISGNQLIDKFSELASNRNVQILSFSPAKETSDNYTLLTSVNLTIESNDYKNIILFVKDIEELPFAVRLDRFIAKIGDTNNFVNNETKEDLIRADVEVSSIKIK